MDSVIDPTSVGVHAICDQCPMRVRVTLLPLGSLQRWHVSAAAPEPAGLRAEHRHEHCFTVDHACGGGGRTWRWWCEVEVAADVSHVFHLQVKQ